VGHSCFRVRERRWRGFVPVSCQPPLTTVKRVRRSCRWNDDRIQAVRDLCREWAMALNVNKLSALTVSRAKRPGYYFDGGCLPLQVSGRVPKAGYFVTPPANAAGRSPRRTQRGHPRRFPALAAVLHYGSQSSGPLAKQPDVPRCPHRRTGVTRYVRYRRTRQSRPFFPLAYEVKNETFHRITCPGFSRSQGHRTVTGCRRVAQIGVRLGSQIRKVPAQVAAWW